MICIEENSQAKPSQAKRWIFPPFWCKPPSHGGLNTGMYLQETAKTEQTVTKKRHEQCS